MPLHRLAFAIACVFALPARAELPDPAPDSINALERILVSATFTAQTVKEIAGETSVILREDMDRQLVQSLRDLLRYEPGVSVSGGGRFGITGITIRGLGGNRVRIETDGVSAPDAFAIGSYSSAGRDFVDLDNLKRVEIVRGAASALHGSDALGGVVSFVTKDPSDYIDAGKDADFFALKGLYDSSDRQSTESLTAASRRGNHGLLAIYTHRDGHELGNHGDVDTLGATRTRTNPQDTGSDALLTKYVHEDGERIERLTLDLAHSDSTTRSLSLLGDRAVGPSQVRVSRLDGDDRKRRARLSVDQSLPLNSALADTLDWRVYSQISETRQDTVEDRATLVGGNPVQPVSRFRRFDYQQRESGLEATLHKSIDGAAMQHVLTYGIDVSGERIREQRDGYQLNLTTGAISNVVSPDTFPVRDFPLSDTRSVAAFMQDDITLFDRRLHLLPGLRYDSYRIDPREDEIFAQDNPGVVPVDLHSDHVSPKLAAIWSFTDRLSAYAQYSTGFRAPPYNDLNVGFTNLQQGYTALPNPDLKAETSRGVEVGLRGDGPIGYFSVAAYRNKYRDFIESLRFIGVDPVSGLMQFQSQNIDRVAVRGAEARGALFLSHFSDALEGFELRSALSFAHGDNELDEEPLLSIDPAKAVVGLAYDSTIWGIELAGTFSAAKRRLPDSGTSTPLFAAPGWSTFDIYAHVEPTTNLQLYAGITNITDRRYWQWPDVSGLSTQSTIARYSAPGRALSAGFKLSIE